MLASAHCVKPDVLLDDAYVGGTQKLSGNCHLQA